MPFGRLVLVSIALLDGAVLAWARPPDGVPLDPALRDRFESLTIPGTEFLCCSLADCRTAEYRRAGTGYEAWLDDRWQSIPQDRVLVGYANPIGRGVVCRTPNGTILCFVPSNDS